MRKINFILVFLLTGSTIYAQTNPACNYLNNLTGYHMVFTDGNVDANWQGASKGFVWKCGCKWDSRF